MYHYTMGQFDQAVIVVADIANTEFDGAPTQDGKTVGVITGYCEDSAYTVEGLCPAWVNQTL